MRVNLLMSLLLLPYFSLAQAYDMESQDGGVLNVCSGTIQVVSGGVNYADDTSYSVTVCAPAGQVIMFDFTAFDYNVGDQLEIFDGPDALSISLGVFTGTSSPGVVISSGTCLTLVHIADAFFNSTGFQANLGCVVLPTCSDGIQNQGETGIDCGGCNCLPCVTAPDPISFSASADTTSLPCGGGTVSLSAIGSSGNTVFDEDFNGFCPGPAWSNAPDAAFDNPCGSGPDGPYMWMDSSTTAPRTMQTLPVDVQCGGEICFSLKYGEAGNASPCDGPNLPNEGVSLLYSSDGGATWGSLAYFHPNGTVTTVNPGTTSPAVSGPTAFTQWGQYCFPIPAAAQSASTIFQWSQTSALGTGNNWGIDQVTIVGNSCTPYYYDWEHIPGSPDAPDVTSFFDEDTTVVVHYTNGVDTLTETIFISVASVNEPNVVLTPEPCYDTDQGTAQVFASGGVQPYQFEMISGPVVSGPFSHNSFYNFNNLPAGNYCIQITDDDGCVSQECFSLPQGPSCCVNTVTFTDPICHSSMMPCSGTATANPSGGIPPYSYQWYDGPDTNSPLHINGAVPSLTGLCAGTYTVEVVDASGCTTVNTVTLIEPSTLSLSVTWTTPFCYGYDSEIDFTASGGTQPYNYSVDGVNFLPSSLQDGPFGNYLVYVQDDNGCQVSQPVNVTSIQNQIHITSISITAMEHCGQCDGEFNTQADGGAPGGYDFTLDPNYTWSNTNGWMNNLCAGTYTVYARDNAGCIDTASVTIINEDLPVITIDQLDHVSCTGGADGRIVVGLGPGGLPPFEYRFNGNGPWGNSNTFTGLSPGTYCIQIRDANGCEDEICATVNEPSPLNVIATPISTLCAGSCDGQIQLQVSGGVAPYGYSTTNGFTFLPMDGSLDTATGLCAGSIDIVVRDTNGCLMNVPVNVPEPPVLVADGAVTDATCGGYSNGSIDASVTTGGTPGYTYFLDGTPQSSSMISGLAAGNYILTVEDANGCTDDQLLNVGQPIPISVTQTSVQNAYCGQPTGSFTVSASGGSGPYTFSSSGGLGTSSAGVTSWQFTGASAGTYTVTVTDANGCLSSTFDVTVADDSSPQILLTQSSDPSCPATCDGEIMVNATGGIPLVEFSIDGTNYQASGVFSGLCAGVYTLYARDANGCVSTLSQTLVEPPVAVVNTSVVDNSCFGTCDGGITLNVSGGTPPYQATTNGFSFSAITSPHTFSGLCAGSYDVEVRDANGCSLYQQTLVVDEPTEVTVAPTTSNTNCGLDNGQVLLVPSGGTGAPYTVEFDTSGLSGGPYVVSGGPFFWAGLASGTYSFLVSDASGCQIMDVVSLGTDLAPNIVNATASSIQCSGDCDAVVTIETSGGTGQVLYSLNGGAWLPGNLPNGNEYIGLCAGQYSIGVQDINGCPDYVTVYVTEPTPVAFSNNVQHNPCFADQLGQISILASGGTPPYQYLYDGVSASPVYSGLAAGSYLVEVVDSYGCTESANLNVSEPPVLQMTSSATTDVSCFGGSDGQVDMAATGGTPGYLFSVDNGGNWFPSGLVTGLAAGTYDLVIRDDNMCQVQAQAVVTEPTQLVLNANVSPASCGQTDGQIQLTGSGGSPNYVYSFNCGASFGASDITTCAAGTYCVQVRDANGCVQTQNVDVIDLDGPVITSVTGTNPLCMGSMDATLTVWATGVTTDLHYDIGGASQTNDGFFDQNSVGGSPGFGAGNVLVTVTDDNGCTDVELYTFTNPTPVVIQANGTDLTCNGDNTGLILVAGIGGTGSYTYSTNNCATSQVTGDFYGLAAGIYDLCIQDGNGCSSAQTLVLNEPPALGAVYTPVDASCYGVCDAQVQVQASGGTPSYLYSSDGGVNWQTSSALGGLCVGNYNVVVEDDHGCQLFSVQGTAQPTPVAVSASSTNETCNGANATITITATGGTVAMDYTYFDNSLPQVANNVFNPVDDGEHLVTIMDDNGCTATDTIDVLSDPTPVLGYGVVTDPKCVGASDGSIHAYASSGVGQIEYSLNGTFPSGNTTGVFTGLSAGNYTVTVQDANGCQDSETFTLTDPAPLSIDNVTTTDADCFGSASGALSVVSSGGTGTHSFSFDGGASFGAVNAQSFLSAGSYDIMVRDVNGCLDSITVQISEPSELLWSNGLDVTDNPCHGDSVGVIDANVVGGVGPYSYNWSHNLGDTTDAVVTGVWAGTFSLTVTDANGCLLADNFIQVSQPPLLQINSVTTQDVVCHGEGNGVVTINSPNAISFSLIGASGSFNQSTGSFDGNLGQNHDGQIPAGNYVILVMDVNGCTASSNTTVYQPGELLLTGTSGYSVCYNEPVAVSVMASGGNGGNVFTWSNDPTVNGPSQTLVLDTDSTLSVTVVDQNGCSAGPVLIDVQVSPPVEISPLINDSICQGGSSTFALSATGGVQPYFFGWTHLNDTTNWLDVTPNEPVSQYTGIVMDGCGHIDSTQVQVVWYPDPGVVLVGAEDGCAPHTVNLVNLTSGQMSGTCLWNTGDGNEYWVCDSVTHIYAYDGQYDISLSYTTAQGCSFDTVISQAINVFPLPEASFLFSPTYVTTTDPTVQFTNTCIGADHYMWNFANVGSSTQEDPIFEFPDLEASSYEVCLRAMSGDGLTSCESVKCQTIHVEDDFIIYVPNVFTPDQDSYNEIFKPVLSGFDEQNYTLYIFDRWGEILFESHNMDVGWDGTYLGDIVKQDVYLWRIEVKDNVYDQKRIYNGHVTLLK